MQFRMKPGPFQRSNRMSTKSIMLELFCVLAVIWVYAIVFNFVSVGTKNGVSCILIGLVSIVCSIACDFVVGLITKVKMQDMPKYLLGSYSYVTGIIFALCLPANTNMFVIICGSVFGTVVGKLFFGGFGHNIVNPAGLGRIFVMTTFTLGSTVTDALGGATVTGSIDWSTGLIAGNYSILNLFLGQYVGAMGEVCSALLIAAGIYLAIRKIIDYRITCSYIITCALIALFLGLIFGVDYVGTYILTHLFTGGMLFGAVFMLTDPVTSPTSQLGKIIFGIGAAMLTMLIRVCGNLPEGVVFSIILMNLFTPLIDSLIKGKTDENLGKKWIVIGCGVVIAILVNIGFALL